jgi:hypothetical protein
MSAQVTISQLPTAGAITGTELVPVVQNGVTVQTTTSAIAGSPTQTYTYLTVSQTSQLPNSRYVGVTNGLTITDGGSQGLFNISTTGALLSLVNSGTGFQVKTSSTAITPRSIATSGAGLSITNGSGVSGDPTIALSGQTLNFANANFNGLVVLSTTGAITSATITGTTSQIGVANGTGVGGNPTISLASDPVIPGTGGIAVPAGTTAQRGTAVDGNLRYNSTTASFEGYANGSWGSIPSGVGVNSISFGTTGLTPATATTGNVVVAGVLAVANGGTGNTTGTATINANLTGAVTSVGNATSLGSFTSAQLSGALTDKTGTGVAVFATSPTLVTPNIGVATGTSFQGIIGNITPAAGTFTTISGAVVSRVVVIANATSITVNADTTDIATQANTQAVGTLTVNAPTGTITNGQKFILRLTSTNVQTFSWNAVFAGSTDIALPTVSSGGGLTDYVGFIYNSTAAKWQMIAKVFGF